MEKKEEKLEYSFISILHAFWFGLFMGVTVGLLCFPIFRDIYYMYINL